MQSIDSEATEKLGASIGGNLRGGEVIELASDLGGGKTTFTRGLVRGAGSTDHVSSPTFTVSKVYEAPRCVIHHFDLYRLEEAGIMRHEIEELQADSKNVLILEWAGVASDVLPKARVRIEFTATSESTREIRIEYPPQFGYLFEELG